MYLRAAGAAVTSVAAMGAVSAQGEDYDVINVPAGGRHTISVGDGETLENVLIDITEPGAKYRIIASGSDWTIRNLGIRGEWDDSSKEEPFIVSVDEGSVGRIENVYLGDGTVDNDPAGTYGNSTNYTVTGIFVSPGHAGTLEIDRVNIQDFGDNAIYASAPGNGSEHPSPGRGGEVHITNAYAARCVPANFRIGTSGSYCKNCVSVDGYRNFWGYYENTEAIDCDFAGSTRIADIVAGDSNWSKGRQAEITVTNTRFDGRISTSGSSRVHGESAGSPQRTEPEEVEGVPLSAEEAASGTSSGSGEGQPREDREDKTDDTDKHVLLFDGSGQGSDWEPTTYSLEVEGGLTPSEHDGAVIDRELELEDGANSVEHVVANWKDAFTFDGDLLGLEVDGPATVYLDGEEIDPDDFGENNEDEEVVEDEHVLLLDGSGQGSDWESTSYSLEVEGELTPSEHEDAVIDPELGLEDGASSVEHVVANWKDAFTFDGDLLSLEVDGPATVYLDGEEIDPDDFGGGDEEDKSNGDDETTEDDSSEDSNDTGADEHTSWFDQWCTGDWRIIRLR